MMQQYRQGDVFIQRIPDRARKSEVHVARDARGRIVLAEGEATGHAHAIDAPHAHLLAVPGQSERHLRIVKTSAFLRHEEHAPIELPPGRYRVVRQREYHPNELRIVAD